MLPPVRLDLFYVQRLLDANIKSDRNFTAKLSRDLAGLGGGRDKEPNRSANCENLLDNASIRPVLPNPPGENPKRTFERAPHVASSLYGQLALNTADQSQLEDFWADVPLTIPKNLARIEAIRTNVMSRTVMRVHSPLIRRWVDREFYFVSERLFILSRGLKTREATAKAMPGLIKDLKFAAVGLQVDALAYEGELNEAISRKTRFDLILVMPMLSTLYRELQRADLAIAQLYMSEYNKMITYEQREAMLQPLHLALVAIKQHAMGYVPKTMAELAEELQIS